MLSDPPSLEKQLKHHIEVVIDRVQVDRSSRSRIAEAIDTAVRVGQGTLLVAELVSSSETGDDTVFSADYACPQCGESYPPPSPQLLSFNSPQGMCPTCNGLGELYTMDPARLILDPKKTIRTGAIELLGKWSSMTRAQRVQLQLGANVIAAKLGIDSSLPLKTPWAKMTETMQSLWLNGIGEQSVVFRFRAGRQWREVKGHFGGIIPYLVSTWHASKNPLLRRQYEKYMHQLPCNACGSERLNSQARFVRLASTFAREETNGAKRAKTSKLQAKAKSKTKASSNAEQTVEWYSLPALGRLPLAKALHVIENLVLSDLQRQIATEALKEIRARLGFLLEVGLEYLSLDRPAPSLFRWRIAAHSFGFADRFGVGGGDLRLG